MSELAGIFSQILLISDARAPQCRVIRGVTRIPLSLQQGYGIL